MSQNLMVLDQLKSDPDFVVEFIVDNNPSEVQAHLSGLNLLGGYPQDENREGLLSDIYSIEDAGTLQEVLGVPYINEVSNYTGGYELDLSVQGSAVGGMQKTGGFGVILVNGIATISNAVSSFLTSQNQEDIAEINQEIIADQTEAERLRLIALEQRENRSKIFGFPPTLFLAILGAVTIIASITLISLRGKN